MPERPPPTAGMHHVALFVTAFDECVSFYTNLLGLSVEWHPDVDNIYLTSGTDNVAIHRAPHAIPAEAQRLDHLGFILNTPEDVDRWHEFLRTHGTPIVAPPKTHRDGARSFYCRDPDGTVVQLIYHPPLAKATQVR